VKHARRTQIGCNGARNRRTKLLGITSELPVTQASTNHELMILVLSSARALARLPAFLRTFSRI
jgi:hypothetical protein